MAKREKKEAAIQLRLTGKSYSEIKQQLGISKGSLSGWLHDYPLSQEKIKELRDNNPRRIEKFRNTMRRKREARLLVAYNEAKKDVGLLKGKELLIGGLFLYWGEGGKTKRGTLTLTNTDPAMCRFFVQWLERLGISTKLLRLRLHLYSDMNIKKETLFWSHKFGISEKHFRKPYIKKSVKRDISYHNGFGHGTCEVILDNQKMADYVLMGLKYLREMYNR